MKPNPGGRVELLGMRGAALVLGGVDGHFVALLVVDDADARTATQARQVLLGLTRMNQLALPEASLVVIHRVARGDDRVVNGARTTLEREQCHDHHAEGSIEHPPDLLPKGSTVSGEPQRPKPLKPDARPARVAGHHPPQPGLHREAARGDRVDPAEQRM